jgi:hypothetical protein
MTDQRLTANFPTASPGIVIAFGSAALGPVLTALLDGSGGRHCDGCASVLSLRVENGRARCRYTPHAA